MKTRLLQLGKLAQLARDAEFSQLARAQSKRQVLTQKRDGLRQARLSALRAATADPAHISGNADAWSDLTHRQLFALAAQEAAAAAEVETLRRTAAQATGRAEVLKQLYESSRIRPITGVRQE